MYKKYIKIYKNTKNKNMKMNINLYVFFIHFYKTLWINSIKIQKYEKEHK